MIEPHHIVNILLQPVINKEVGLVLLVPFVNHCRLLQGVSLVLSSYQAWRYHPEGGSLRALAANLRGRLGAFTNSELASCIEAFSALGFHPGNDIVQVNRSPACLSLQHPEVQ